MARNYYDILGVSKNASEKDIRQAYRKLARKYHPDVNPGDSTAEAKFKEINEAYQVLSDPEARKKYDRFGENWKRADQFAGQGARGSGPFSRTYTTSSGPGGGFRTEGFDLDDLGDLGDLFGGFFRGGGGTATAGRRRRATQPTEHPVDVSLEEAFHGTSRVLQVQTPTGEVKRLEVRVPPGVDTGSRVHIPAPDVGDLYLVVTVLPHEQFQRDGSDLTTEVSVSLTDVVLGSEVQVPTLKGRVALRIPPETQNGRVFRLAGQGMPLLNQPDRRGDLYARVRVTLPTGLSERERELFEELRQLRGGRR